MLVRLDLAMKYDKELMTLDLPLDEDSLDNCIAQIVAEEKQTVWLQQKKLIKTLQSLHNEPWQTLQEFEFFKHQGDRRSLKRDSIYHIETSQRLFRTLQCKLNLDADFAKEHVTLLPLFRVIAIALLDNITNTITEDYGYFDFKSAATYKPNQVQESRYYRAYTKHIARLTTELASIKNTIAWMQLCHFTDKIIAMFDTNSPTEFWLSTPGDLTTFEATDVLIGMQGWKTIATKNNIDTLLRHMQLQLAWGDDRQTIQLAALPKRSKSKETLQARTL